MNEQSFPTRTPNQFMIVLTMLQVNKLFYTQCWKNQTIQHNTFFKQCETSRYQIFKSVNTSQVICEKFFLKSK